MRLSGGSSGNIEDRRGNGGKYAIGGGVGILAVILGLIFGGDPGEILGLLQQGGGAPTEQSTPVSSPADAEGKFVDNVLLYTEEVWTELFRGQGLTYEEPNLVLFSNSVSTYCGAASSASGPFYCPADSKVYIDLSFNEELSRRFGAPGDFAKAYVIAHEVGHHVQHLLGTTEKVDAMRSRLSEAEYNRLSVKLELQADFYAGVWAHHAQKARNILESGDLEEALAAANAIGDDRLQREAGQEVVPDAFTHGTSAQRMFWFRKGFDTGDMLQGDTFKAAGL